jgi:DNA-binding response OmpR family regulator
MRIAILDDDAEATQLISDTLQAQGMQCECFGTAKALLKDLHRQSFDCLLIDWMLPDTQGTEVMEWVRANLDKRVPIIFITSRSGEADAIAVLNAGADDYMTKPLRLGELAARVKALVRRTQPQADEDALYQIDRFKFDTRTLRAWDGETEIELTQKEFNLALLFLRNVGRPLSRSHIMESVWGRDGDVPSRTMDTHVSRVRSKLDLRPSSGYLLAPVYSYGYRLEQIAIANA